MSTCSLSSADTNSVITVMSGGTRFFVSVKGLLLVKRVENYWFR